MAGYTRNDTSNNIATGNVINAADLDGEFDALVAAFHASTGHTHDGTAANGAPITKIGPAQDLVISTGAITPKTDNTVDLGSSSFEFKDLYIDGTANIDALVADTADINAGTIDGVTLGTNSAVTEAQIDNININGNTISSTDTNGNISLVPNGTGDVILTADTIQVGDSNTDVTVTTNGTGDLIFNTNAGTNSGVIRIYDGANGNIALTPNGTGEVDISKVDIDSGAIDGTAIGANSASTGAFTTLSASSTVTLSGGTANGVLYLNGSKVATSGSALTFDGTNFAVGGVDSYNNKIIAKGVASYTGLALYTTTASARPTISLVNENTATKASYIQDSSAGELIFGQMNYDFGGHVEGMRLTSTGLGIGTSSPASKLDVSTSTTDVVRFTTSAASDSTLLTMQGGSGVRMRILPTSGTGKYNWQIATQTNIDNGFEITPSTASGGTTFSTPALSILASSGNVGIGTSSPSAPLVVNKTGWAYSGNAYLTGVFVDGSGNKGVAVGYDNTSQTGIIYPFTTSAASSLSFWTYPGSGSITERMRLDSSGNLGLGVTPSAWGSTYRAAQVGLSSSLVGITNDVQTHLTTNARFDGTNWIYIATSPASRYMQDNNVHKWFNAASGTAGNAITFTQAMTLDASGNLGVGLTSPGVRIDADGIIRSFSAGTTQRYLAATNSAGTFESGVLPGGDSYAGSVTNDNFVFYTNATERARITSGGDLLVGTTSGYGNRKFEVRGGVGGSYLSTFGNTSSSPNGIQIYYDGYDPNGTGNYFLTCNGNGTVRVEIRSNGGIANYSANDVNLSDRREKTNLAPAKSYLDTICAIPVQTFNYIDQSEDDPGLTLGVVAQDVQAVAPELVMESNWGTEENPKMRLSIYQTDLQYALMKCIQEQQALITSLTARVALLEGN